MKNGTGEMTKRPGKKNKTKQVNNERGTELKMSAGMSEPDLELGKECRKGKLLVVLAKFLLAGFQVIEELSPTDGPCDTSPSCPEVLHPAQGTAIQQNSGLGYCCKGKDRHFLATVKIQRGIEILP